MLVMGVGRSWKREREIWESVRKRLRERERVREIRVSQIYQVFLSKEAVGGGGCLVK